MDAQLMTRQNFKALNYLLMSSESQFYDSSTNEREFSQQEIGYQRTWR